MIPTLPSGLPTEADRERVYNLRGLAIMLCDGRRQLAVDTHAEEHRLEALARQGQVDRRRTWLQRVTPWTEAAPE